MGALVALVGVLFAGLLPFANANFNTPALKVQATDSTLQVCVDQSGKPLTGDIELMLVMDNSTSLKETDEDNVRFSQVETLLRSVHNRISESKNPRAVKFSLITFGKGATVVIPRSKAIVLNDANIDGIRRQVERAAPGNDPGTDYVKALEKAIDELEGKSENCRVIVWFTDGAYFTGNEVDSKENGTLRDEVCKKPDGISQKLREFNINIFPLYFEPKEIKGDRTASKDVMAHLTGDSDAFRQDPYQAGKPCDGPWPTHIGEVLAASNVNQLGQFFADLTNIIEGGEPVACPTKNGSIESKPLPAGRYISQISIVKYSGDGEELEPEDLQAVQPDGKSRSLDNYFEGDNGRYVANDAARELQPGWKIKGTESIGSEHCIRAFARQGLSVQIKKSEVGRKLVPIGPEKVWLEGEDLTSAEGDAELPVVRLGFDADCQTKTGTPTDTTGLDKAFDAFPEGGTGVICVDPSESKVFARGVGIAVTRDDQPLVSCDALVIRREGSDEFIKRDKTERSNTCEIDFADTNSKFIKLVSNFNSVFDNSIDSCNIDAIKSTIEPPKQQGNLVSLSFRVVLDQNERTNCSVKDREIVIEYKRENGELVKQRISASIVLDLQPEPDRVAARIATILTVLTLVGLALAILRRMTVSAAALIPPNKMCAARFSGIATKHIDGRISLEIENRQFRDVRVDMDRIEKTRIDGTDSKLEFSDSSDEIVIRREMPPIRLMLRDPWAWVDDKRPYVVHPNGRRAPAHEHLPAPFRDAIVALDDGPLKGSSTERLVTIWVIQKKGASQGDQVAIEESLKEHGAMVIETLFDVVGLAVVHDGADAGTEPPTTAPQGLTDTGNTSVPPPPNWDDPPDWN
jgi:von Willebrand factor type A domain